MSFATDVANWCQNTAPESVKTVARKCIFEMGSRAVFMSPVGDAKYWSSPAPAGYTGGRFRGNWQYQFGSVKTDTTPRIDPSGRETISDIQGSMVNEFGVHTISNNLPYAERIEDGWSHRQAPQGIVKLIQAELPDIFRIASA